MNGHPRDQAKVSVHCRWPLIRDNLTLKCVGRGIDYVAVQGRWPLTTGVAQGRYYCIFDTASIESIPRSSEHGVSLCYTNPLLRTIRGWASSFIARPYFVAFFPWSNAFNVLRRGG